MATPHASQRWGTRDPVPTETRDLLVTEPFDLAATCGPVAWVGDRSPRHHWEDGTLTWVGWEHDRVVTRQVWQAAPERLVVTGSASPEHDAGWAAATFGFGNDPPVFTDPGIKRLHQQFPGLHPYCDGSIFDGLVTSIVGQSISVAAAAITQKRLTALFTPPLIIGNRGFAPLPTAERLADASPELVRTSGVTWRRAEALVFAAREALAGNLPATADALNDGPAAARALLGLPLVGNWTAQSTLLWGIGAPDAYPAGDVALLRAVRLVYNQQEATLMEMDAIAEAWRPARGHAARLLWTALFGPPPGGISTTSERTMRG